MAAEHVPSSPLPHPIRLRRPGSAVPHRRRLPPVAAVFEQVGRPTTDGVTWLWARTDLDVATVGRARTELSAVFTSRHEAGNVLVHLGRECFVDLRGLRVLVDAARRIRSLGGALAVVAPPRSLTRLMQAGHVDVELPLIPTARQAAWWVRTHGTGLR
jgi:anti-anti-sigma factor